MDVARDDALCVMHSHTTAGMAVAAQEQGLPLADQTANSAASFFGTAAFCNFT
jgi:ribulose-5-phosphate 4-epimerase/fuculose-1-phosphate aldolase